MDDLNRQGGDDQIGVITLMRLMWKWKMVILGGILLGCLVGFTISVLLPHVYEVDMLVENVQIGTNKAGDKSYLGNFQNISKQISAGAFNQDILKSLSEQYKEALPRRISFKVSLKNDNQFAGIAYETVDVEMGKEILSQLFKRMQETTLVRVAHWKKEIDSKIEEKRDKIVVIKAQMEKEKERIVLAQKTEQLRKQEMLDRTKADKEAKEVYKRAKEDTIEQLQKQIDNVAMKRKSDISEKMSDLMAEKMKNAATIKSLDKRNSGIKTSIKFIKSEMELLINIRKELLSKRNESRNMGVVGELSSTIMDGYGKLDKLKQRVLAHDDQVLLVRFRIQELDNEIEELKKESGVKPSEIEVLNDKIAQARLDIEALESQTKELSDKSAMSSSTEKLDSVLEDTTEKARSQVTLIEEEVGILEANKKKVKNIVLLQSPTSGVSALRPNTRKNVVIGAVVGLFLSLFLSVFLEYVYKKDGSRGELNR